MKTRLILLAAAVLALLCSSSCRKGGKEIAVTGITLSQPTLTLAIGDDFRLKASVTPDNATDKTLEWESDDTAVATVDGEGLIKAKAVGAAVVSASAVSTKGAVRARCIVTVTDKQVSGVSVEPAELTLMEGETASLSAKVSPDGASQKVQWASQDTNVATVDEDGLVTAVGAGLTRIYARSQAYPDIMGWSAILVLPDTRLKGITLNADVMTLKPGETQTLSVIYNPEHAGNKNVSWSSGNPSVAVVSQEGAVTGFSKGSTVITARAEDGGHTATCTVTVTDESGTMVYWWTNIDGCCINGSPDPRNSLYYQIDGKTAGRYNYAYASCIFDKTLYSIEQFSIPGRSPRDNYVLCKDRAPLFVLPGKLMDEGWDPECLMMNKDFFAFFCCRWNTELTVWKGDYSGNMTEIPISGSFADIYNMQAALTPDGKVIVSAKIRNVFGELSLAAYTVSTSNEVSEQIIVRNHDWSEVDVAVSEEGDIYFFGLEGPVEGCFLKAFIIKNGEKQDADFISEDFYFDTAITCRGGHVYTAICDYNRGKTLIRKDGELLYTINSTDHLENGNPLVVTESGDIYLALYTEGTGTLYKNGGRLYTVEALHPFRCYCVME